LIAGKHPFQRLRSTEARDLGMRPLRPRGVTNQQWRSLQLGLSWYRESRSLLVREWLAKLGLAPIAKRLPPPHALDTVHTPQSSSYAVPPVALLMSLIATLGLWIAFSHASFDMKLIGMPFTADETSSSLGVQQKPVNQMAMFGATVVPQLTPIDYVEPPFVLEPRSVRRAGDAAPSLESGRHESIFAIPQAIGADRITISADAYRVNSGEHFAQVNVRRSDESTGNGSFVWWTEASSAKPGNDFVAQNRTTQAFQKGRRWARLFIRIVPNPSRTHTERFYVVIGKPVGGYSLGPIIRAAVLIPPLG
jgi:hypothetical protein